MAYRSFACLASIPVIWLVGCSASGPQPAPLARDAASAKEAAAVAPEGEEGNLRLRLELLEPSGGRLPSAIRLTLHNESSRPIEFTEPAPLLPEVDPAMEETESPRLALMLRDASGRDTDFPPVYTEPKARTQQAPRQVALEPGGAWSKEYPLAAFYFWGPCGPAGSFSRHLDPGGEEVHARALIAAADGTRRESNAIVLRCEVPGRLFGHLTEAEQAEELQMWEVMKDSPDEFAVGTDQLPWLIESLREHQFETRTLAASALRAMGGRAKPAVPALVELLQSKEMYADRVIAADTLRGIGPEAKEAVPALTAALEDGNDHVRQAAKEALAKIKGRYPETKDEDRAGGVELDSLEKLPFDADGVFFILDRSGSTHEHFAPAKRFIERALSSFGDDVQFGVIFSDRGVVQFPAEGPPARAGEEGKARARDFIRSAGAGVASCPQDAFLAALRLVDASTARRNAIVFISDGGGTCRGGSEETYLEETFDVVTEKNGGRAQIHTFALPGSAAHRRFLRHLADKNAGTYTPIAGGRP